MLIISERSSENKIISKTGLKAGMIIVFDPYSQSLLLFIPRTSKTRRQFANINDTNQIDEHHFKELLTKPLIEGVKQLKWPNGRDKLPIPTGCGFASLIGFLLNFIDLTVVLYKIGNYEEAYIICYKNS